MLTSCGPCSTLKWICSLTYTHIYIVVEDALHTSMSSCTTLPRTKHASTYYPYMGHLWHVKGTEEGPEAAPAIEAGAPWLQAARHRVDPPRLPKIWVGRLEWGPLQPWGQILAMAFQPGMAHYGQPSSVPLAETLLAASGAKWALGNTRAASAQ